MNARAAIHATGIVFLIALYFVALIVTPPWLSFTLGFAPAVGMIWYGLYSMLDRTTD